MTYKTNSDHHQTLVQVFTWHGGTLHQDEFDHEFLNRNSPMSGWEKDDTIYTGGWNGYIWLEILQHAISEGHFTRAGKPPNMVYALPKPVLGAK